MLKGKPATRKKQKKAAVRVNECGPIGLDLFVEVMNWDADSVNPAEFKEPDYRWWLLRALTKDNPAWREDLKSVQSRLRKEFLGVLEPPPSMTLPEPRMYMLQRLFAMLNGYNWPHLIMIDMWSGRDVRRFSMYGELPRTLDRVEIGRDRFVISYEFRYRAQKPRWRAGVFEEALYAILHNAILTRQIGKLRVCRSTDCRKWFTGHRAECSGICRSRINYASRKKNYYKLNKELRVKKAKRLRKLRTPIDAIMEETGLSYLALKRAEVI